MSTSDNERKSKAQVVAMESNKAGDAAAVVVVATAVATAAPAQKQRQMQSRAGIGTETNNNNVSSKSDLCHEPVEELRARASDRNSSPRAGDAEESTPGTRSEFERNQSRDKRQRHKRDGESSPALPANEDEQEDEPVKEGATTTTTTKVKSSSDCDNEQRQQREPVASAHSGDMSAQRTAAAGVGRESAQVAEDTARDKQRELDAAAADGEQVEQTHQSKRGARERQEQSQPPPQPQPLGERTDAHAEAKAGRRPTTAQVGQAATAAAAAATQGQGQGQLAASVVCAPADSAPATKQTNSADQNKTPAAAVTATQGQHSGTSGDKCNGSGNYSKTSSKHYLVRGEKDGENNITNGDIADQSEHHHILELSENHHDHHHDDHHHHDHQNHQSEAGGDQLPYFTTTRTKTTTDNNNKYNSQYFKSPEHTQTTLTTTKRLSYLQALLLRKWPCYALTICIMSSLLFGFLLSAATVLLMHGYTNCNAELAHLSASMSAASVAASGGDHLPPHSFLTDHHSEHSHDTHHHHQHAAGAAAAAAAASLLPTPLGLADLAAATPTHEAAERRLGPDSAPGPVANAAVSDNDNKQLTNKTSLPRDSGAPSGHFQRLPAALVPQHYNLFVWPLIAGPSFPFNGSVEIHLTCKHATSNITLHSLELTIPESSIKLSKLPTPPSSPPATLAGTRGRRQAVQAIGAPRVAKLSHDKQLQYSIIHLDAPLEPGQDYLLRLDFAGKLNDDLAGFYKMNYERQNSSEPTWIAATQFQATDARRAFPCFDEPLYKATFSIKIRHWTNMTALSNMPIVSSEKSQDGLWITDTFAKSQRMSTYLVAWAVTNFESRTAGNITVWTRPGFVHTAQYALEIAGRILRHYEDFFGIAYPLPKMDMIALPDFNAGAMENWGLITYRETAMLYDPESSSVANKQRVAVVVAHELAHQWFGNLVTPKWWDDLWLNEGFASFVEYLGVDHVEPRWRMLEQFTVEEVQNVFKLDALSSSHQISIPVNNPDEISEIFDHISYAKGASIIRMMRHFITAPVFQLGLQRYLRALKYNNAEQADLWSHLRVAQQELRLASAAKNATPELQQLQDVDVDQVMNSWTLQTGYPLVTLTRRYDSQSGAQLEQVRYQPYKIVQDANSGGNKSIGGPQQAAAAAGAQNRWEIPITYTWKSEQNWEPTTRLWMRANQSAAVEIAPQALPRDPTEWVILNMQQVGYYRVNYDLQNWRYLIRQLQEDHTKIGTTNRAQLLDDLFELARSSLVDYQLAMESTKYLRNERDYLPWESVLLALGTIDEMLQRTPLYGEWQDYFAQVLEPLYARYKDFEWTKSNQTTTSTTTTIDTNDVLEQYNQVNAVSWACQTNNQHCIGKARRVFANWRKSGRNEIQPSMRYAAYCAAIQYGNKDDWDFLWRVYEREQGAVERDRILRALGCSKEMWILARYLDWIFDKSKPIRRQDGAFVFRMIAKNNYGRDIAFNFMRERWPTIREYYGKTSFTLGHLIKSVASGMSTQVELDQLKRFHESIKNDVGTGKRSFQIAIEEVESNLYWRNKNYKILEKWLQENQKERKQAPAA